VAGLGRDDATLEGTTYTSYHLLIGGMMDFFVSVIIYEDSMDIDVGLD